MVKASPRGGPPRFASAAIATYAAQLGAAVLSFANVLVVSRVLGPSGRGEVAYLTTIAVLSSNVALFGLQEANANIAASESEQRRSLATNSIVLSIVLGGLCVALLAPLVAVFPGVANGLGRGVLWLALGSIPALILQVYLQFLVAADFGFGMYNMSWLLPALVNVVANGVLAGAGALTVATGFGTWVGGQALATALLLWYVGRRSAGFGRPDLPLAGRSLRFGLKTHFARLMMFGNYRADQWFVGGLAGARELGLYSIAVAWSEVLFYLPTALVVVQRPYLVRASGKEAAGRAAAVFRASCLITAACVVGVILLAPILCVSVFGSGFRGSIDDLRVLALGAFGIVAVKQLGNALTAQRRPGLSSVAAGIAFAASIVLDIILVPSHGGLGAAIASTLSYTLGGAAVAFFFVRILGARASELVPRAREIPWFVREVWRLGRARRAPDVATATASEGVSAPQ
jgi:O-antigen/teichoic acid export membrane protein